MGMAEVSEGKSKAQAHFKPLLVITSANILLVKASHMTKPKGKGKSHTVCLLWRNCMASWQKAPNTGRGEELGLIILSVTTINT